MKKSIIFLYAATMATSTFAQYVEDRTQMASTKLEVITFMVQVLYYSLFLILPLGLFMLWKIYISARRKEKLRKRLLIAGIFFTVYGASIYIKSNLIHF